MYKNLFYIVNYQRSIIDCFTKISVPMSINNAVFCSLSRLIILLIFNDLLFLMLIQNIKIVEKFIKTLIK